MGYKAEVIFILKIIINQHRRAIYFVLYSLNMSGTP